MKKIAVCISGQSRTWNYCKENITRFFNITHMGIEQAEVDFFLHTWDTNTYKEHIFGTSTYSAPWDESADCNGIVEHFNPKMYEIESYNKFKAIRDNVYTFPVTAWEPMYHSYKKSIHFKRTYELENEFEYDLVIKTRFDCIFNPNIPMLAFTPEPMKAYSSRQIHRMANEFGTPNFDEAVFFGDSKTMDLLSLTGDAHIQNRILSISPKFIFDPEPEMYYGPGTLIYRHMTNMNICPDYHYQPFNYFVARKHVVESGLSPITDWDKVVVSCQDWYR